ncbi:hypothetical protein PJK45_00450 [Mycobacterium kansasii]|nr:hypothetical protein [Mycobacterium kansasii]EUA05755.1 hypothetical protein I547_1417 [Mycobacterium kansasii 824]AGZ54347.1 hypothetical protein MKAN_19835 [Mycobacterium kansasii ATCC 12478]EUA21586.1 hypothetical protein I545_0037 [Mycobacterium kansasii 662]KEP43917.1 hypothetical protein MKSMC1_09930 [Mycobacterium kansasii]OOK67785.1 hypothetical protein BZL30_7946 [Mycobacterium kansasii]
MSNVVIATSAELTSTELSPADLKALRDVNEKIAIARTDPTRIADDAWLCPNAVV